MRILLSILALLFCVFVQAQMDLPVNGFNYPQQDMHSRNHSLSDSNNLQKKWFVRTYAGLSSGVGFFNGGNTTFLSPQIGLQLNRRLNNNLYAFAGVTATPVFFNANRSFSNANLHRTYMSGYGFNPDGLRIYSGIQAGLMYVNDAKTFSISGSIGVSNSSNPLYSSPRTTTQKQSAFTGYRQ